MNASMNIGILRGVIMVYPVDDRLRFLAGGSVIQVNKELPTNFLPQSREILSHMRDIVGTLCT
jgi:hypothetical protein